MKKIVVTGVVAGIIVFLWGMFSWMVLPWHMNTIEKFKSELVVENVLKTNTNGKGMYMLPNAHGEGKEKEKEAHDKMAKGPSALVIFNPGSPMFPFPFCMIAGLVMQILGGCLLTWILLQTSFSTFFSRLIFIKVVAFFGALMAYVPNWIWWQFSTSYTLVGIIDFMIAWSLAGIWISKATAKS